MLKCEVKCLQTNTRWGKGSQSEEVSPSVSTFLLASVWHLSSSAPVNLLRFNSRLSWNASGVLGPKTVQTPPPQQQQHLQIADHRDPGPTVWICTCRPTSVRLLQLTPTAAMNQTKVEIEPFEYTYYEYPDWYSENAVPTKPPKEWVLNPSQGKINLTQ